MSLKNPISGIGRLLLLLAVLFLTIIFLSKTELTLKIFKSRGGAGTAENEQVVNFSTHEIKENSKIMQMQNFTNKQLKK